MTQNVLSFQSFILYDVWILPPLSFACNYCHSSHFNLQEDFILYSIKTAETQKSWLMFGSWCVLKYVPAPAGGYFNPSQNGTVDSDGRIDMALPLTVSPSSFTTLSGTGGLSWISKECLSSSLVYKDTQTNKRKLTNSISYFWTWQIWCKNVKKLISLPDWHITDPRQN